MYYVNIRVCGNTSTGFTYLRKGMYHTALLQVLHYTCVIYVLHVIQQLRKGGF